MIASILERISAGVTPKDAYYITQDCTKVRVDQSYTYCSTSKFTEVINALIYFIVLLIYLFIMFVMTIYVAQRNPLDVPRIPSRADM